jgi:hypothetical protein
MSSLCVDSSNAMGTISPRLRYWQIIMIVAIVIALPFTVLQAISDFAGHTPGIPLGVLPAKYTSLDGADKTIGGRLDWHFRRPGNIDLSFIDENGQSQTVPTTLIDVDSHARPAASLAAFIFCICALGFAAALTLQRPRMPAARSLAMCLLLMSLPIADQYYLWRWLSVIVWVVNSYAVFLIPLCLIAFTTQFPGLSENAERARFQTWFVAIAIVCVFAASAVDAYEIVVGPQYVGAKERFTQDRLAWPFYVLYIPMLYIFIRNSILVFRTELKSIRAAYARLCVSTMLLFLLMAAVYFTTPNQEWEFTLQDIADFAAIIFLIIIGSGWMRRDVFDLKFVVRGVTWATIASLFSLALINIVTELITPGSESKEGSATSVLLIVIAVILSTVAEPASKAIGNALTAKLAGDAATNPLAQRAVEDENTRMKLIIANLTLENDALKRLSSQSSSGLPSEETS